MDSRKSINIIFETLNNYNIRKTRLLTNIINLVYILFFFITIFATIFFKNGWILWFVWFDFIILSLILYDYSYVLPLFYFPAALILLYLCGYNLLEGKIYFLPCVSGLIIEILAFIVVPGVELFATDRITRMTTLEFFNYKYRLLWDYWLLDFAVVSFKFIEKAPYIVSGILLFFPLLSSILLLLFGKKIGNKFAGLFSSGMIGAATFSAIFFWLVYPLFALKLATYILKLFLREHKYHSGFIERCLADKEVAAYNWGEILEISVERHSKLLELSELFFKFNLNNSDIQHLYNKLDPEIYFNFGNIVSFFYIDFTWSLKFDNLTLAFSSVILFISLAVHLFSCDYMKNDANQVRFFSFLSLFTFFMLLLVCAYDFVVFYIAWEGVGVCSFLLISFWFTRVQAIKAAIKALLINKVGDVLLLIAGAVIFKCCSTLDFGIFFFVFPIVGNKLIEGTTFTHIDLVCFLLMMASLIKSAQLFFHVWLADAMEGPTPVSALLHAATMVTAGVFLIIRFSFIFEYSAIVLNFLVYISVLTMIIISIIGLFQYDIKKIIAYSTCSQLGIMFLACGLSGYTFALFHFFNHAFFKALMFMSAGNIIHALGNEQDIRKMGGLKNILPFSYMTFLISSLSLVGFPFFSGYYSKDAIVLLAYSKLIASSEKPSYILYYAILFSLALTCFYSFRLIYYVFLGNSTRISNYLHNNIKEEINFFNAAPLFTLAMLSIFSGYLFNFYFIGVGSNFFYESSILTFCEDIKFYLFHKIVKLHVLFVLIFSYVFCIIFCYVKESTTAQNFKFYYNKKLYKIFCFFNKKAYFDDLYNLFLSSKIYRMGHDVYILIDKGLLEILGPRGISYLVFKCSRLLKKAFNSGPTTHLIFLAFLGVVILLGVALILHF